MRNEKDRAVRIVVYLCTLLVYSYLVYLSTKTTFISVPFLSTRTSSTK